MPSVIKIEKLSETFIKTGLFLQSFSDIPVGTSLVQYCKDMNFFTFNSVNYFLGELFKKNSAKIFETDF